MWRYIIRRVFLQGIPVLLGFTFLLYLLLTIAPGSPVSHLRGVPNIDEAVIAQREAQLGINEPFIVQYTKWLGRVVRGDLGLSFDSSRRPVAELILERMPATILLSVCAIVVGWGIDPCRIYLLVISIPFSITSSRSSPL